jgi:hypothetical protein
MCYKKFSFDEQTVRSAEVFGICRYAFAVVEVIQKYTHFFKIAYLIYVSSVGSVWV